LITLLWTLKEGYVKAIGEGIGFGLDRISVDIDVEAERATSISVDGRDITDDGWSWSNGWIGIGLNQYGWTVFWKGENRNDPVELQNISWEDFIQPFIDT